MGTGMIPGRAKRGLPKQLPPHRIPKSEPGERPSHAYSMPQLGTGSRVARTWEKIDLGMQR